MISEDLTKLLPKTAWEKRKKKMITCNEQQKKEGRKKRKHL